MQLRLSIGGMHCGGCVRRVESVLRSVPGVGVEAVSVGSATLRLDADKVSAKDVVNALAARGYPAQEGGGDERG